MSLEFAALEPAAVESLSIHSTDMGVAAKRLAPLSASRMATFSGPKLQPREGLMIE